MKADLHCHSKYSKRPTLWLMQKIGCPESFTDPQDLYRILRQMGMRAVTITDHNVIDGCLEIAHYPETFISEEVTTYFPEDRCKIHILVYGITEQQHQIIQEIRPNIFDLVDYLNQENILHSLAHPFFGVNDRLTLQHFEQLLLLFKHFELNGDQNGDANRNMRKLLDHLTPRIIEELANRHDLEPIGTDPWIKYYTGGSDDHSSLHLGRTYTEVGSAQNLDGFLNGLREGQTRIFSKDATPYMLAHNVYGIAYQFYRNRFQLDRYSHKDLFLKFLDQVLTSIPPEKSSLLSKMQMRISQRRQRRKTTQEPSSILGFLRKEAYQSIQQSPGMMRIVSEGITTQDDTEKIWFQFVNEVANGVTNQFGNRLLDRILGVNFVDIFHSIGSVGALATLLGPYFAAYKIHSRVRRFSQEVLENLLSNGSNTDYQDIHVAHFTDTYYEVNGVAKTLQQEVSLAEQSGKECVVITCHDQAAPDRKHLKNFCPIGSYQVPEYSELSLFVPPFLEILDYCYQQKVTHIHSATPGPVGLAALAVARILNLPIFGTYHTSFSEFARFLFDDTTVEDLVWRFTSWYYNQLDTIYVPSHATGQELIEGGLDSTKIKLYPRGIDTNRFHPVNRNGFYADRFGVTSKTILLYVGRVSKEKNLHLLAEAYRVLCQKTDQIFLAVIGDGPYLNEMKQTLAGYPCGFTGYLDGEDLSKAYASGDIFVFPSTTDTFGNVVLEAQASGLPVIVSDKGGPSENLIHEKTGIIVPSNSAKALEEAMERLVSNRAMRISMAKSARQYAEGRSFEKAFDETWKLYATTQSSDFDYLEKWTQAVA